MPGEITGKAGIASTTLAVTNLHSLASSADYLTGWGSVGIDKSSFLDYSFGAKFVSHASNRQAGQINIYVVGSLNSTPIYPATATGTAGTEGLISFVDTEERDSACKQLGSITVDASASAVLDFSAQAVAHLFGGVLPPFFFFYVSQNCGTTTTAGLAAAGSAAYGTPSYGAYT